eukprot:CAMPEP_0197318524 /NCGR_PEP_ID=MMETSP0891-20130614/51422_1 /TAXON_ID=44058 ORGANISM="Aureoumbra lagunensis, Strain CCMP1510" /NCGR_SAMPLE_ID=MMETSP0891 /ASSEMBLY_ACC=CAM_ASM_000534 /LENGTH=602 /DNA_ID=CAMNT_0042809031 /DNA_START=75 /DNA_END=1883 /DNA_ORIENTATION=+
MESNESREAAKAARKARRKLAKQKRQELEGVKTRGHGARSERRGSVFVRWLLETYGIDRLRVEGVVDVAGGRGEISARLAHCHQIPCVLMDPRATMESMEDTLIRRVARHLPQKFRQDLERAGYSERLRRLVRVQATEFQDVGNINSILIGMHADGATEAIVDYALAHNLSFAIVPCCVFAKNKNLFEPDTKKLLSYESFCDYLQNKAPDTIRRSVLDFDGRNIVLYAVSTSYRLCDNHITMARRAMLKNQPLLMRNVVSDWYACKHWVSKTGDFDRQALTACLDQDESAPQLSQDGDRSSILVIDYLADKNWPPSTYLKDWHVPHFYRNGWCTTPKGFESDWLGTWLHFVGYEDFDFCYIGPKGSRTSEHADVLSTYSWSANIAGRKHWWLQPPNGTTHIFIDQGPRDVVFVPSDWIHSVSNIEDTCSINRNWFNACAIRRVYAHLLDRRKEVLLALGDDCRSRARSQQEWLWTVENVLRLDARLSISDLLAIIYHHLVRLFSSSSSSLLFSDHIKTKDEEDDSFLLPELSAVLADLERCFDEHTLFLDSDLTRFPTDDNPDSWSKNAQVNALTAIRTCRNYLKDSDHIPSYREHLRLILY